VLELAEDPSVPLLERFRFLSIVSSNLDELFLVRAGRLKRGELDLPAGGGAHPPRPDLKDLLAVRVRALMARQGSCLRRLLLPALEEAGTRIRRWADLTEEERAELGRHFERRLLPVLTPRALTGSPGQPFPHLESLRLSLAVMLEGADTEEVPLRLAQVTIPPDLGRFLPVQGTRGLIAVEEVVEGNVSALFPGVNVTAVHAFRVTRTGEVDIDEASAESLLMAIEDEVEARPFKPPVRLEVERGTPREVLAYLLRNLRHGAGGGAALDHSDVFEVDEPLDLRGFAHLTSLDVPDGVYPAFHPPAPWPSDPVFDLLRARDRMVHHPFEAFDATVTRFLTEAAADPHVLAIKITLYRTGSDSPFAAALLEALRNGKDVAVFVELKARFDEASNIGWTRRILEAGGHVVYGVVGFKTHAKVALVVRREGEEVRRYVHIGTGNYNATTSRFYTDLSLLSADADLGADVSDFFNELTGSAGPPVKEYRRLLVAPSSLADTLDELVEAEIAHAREGRPARIVAKLNGLTDRRMARSLYRASEAGVEVDLIVRSACCVRPGVPGLSSRIRVRSILGRFLEHARIYHFAAGGAGAYYVASADWRKRNLRNRVEIAAPVDDPEARARLEAILDADLADPRAWVMRPDGAYQRLNGEGLTAQECFLREATHRVRPAVQR
jgi:polyphosphate kinase